MNNLSELFIKAANRFTLKPLKKFIVGIFYLSGGPISQHRLRRSLLDVENYAFTGRRLVATITSTRE